MKNRLAVLLLAVSALAAPLAARADLIWDDGFNYGSNGDLSTISSNVWVNFSGSKDLLVTNNILQLGSTGGGVNRSGDENRSIPGPYTNQATVLYASFTMTATNFPNGFGTYFAAYYRTNASPQPGGFSGRINSFTNGVVTPGCFRLGCTGNVATTNPADGGLPVDLALNTQYQVVARLDPITQQALTIWVNPISESDPNYHSKDPLNFAISNQFAINAFAFRQASSASGSANTWFCYITNVALATTFQEALTNVLATNAVNPTLVTAPAGITNFTGVPVSFYAVVNGQGQLGITYQWFKGGAPFSNPNGNSPILSFSNPQPSDSGNYNLVATTPYGLSVTSSPVPLNISNPLIPPTIKSGPDSQLLYVGESVIFSVQVSSPGNISYQWKSNGVNIDGATASTYEIDNLQTNYSANYSVGVTNDVVPNGVVSSNAVLTVDPAQKVSIGFLRTLVDPNTFLPTIAPVQPFDVTGVVTTFTNITSGDTASYWLQDGTGGINIFVTFGSTFRPMQGDEVSFTGVLSSFTSGLELDVNTNGLPQTSYEDLSSGNPLPTPIVIPFTITTNLSNVNANIAGSLVTLTNVYFGTNAGTTISTNGNVNLTVTNAQNQSFTVSFFDLDLDTAGQTLPTFASSVTGVLYGLSPTYSVAVTKFSDIVTQVTVNPIPLTAKSTNGNIVISWADASFTLQSSTNATGGYTNVPSATSPYTNATTGPALYFRLKH